MQKPSTCKYLDYGNTAPRDYGRYCTVIDKISPVQISESACDECSDFTPSIMSFEAWYTEVFRDQSCKIEISNWDMYEILFSCWNAALAVARRRGMM